MSDLLALADEIERAAEGSRELDARIATAINWWPREFRRVDSFVSWRRWTVIDSNWSECIAAPKFTTSLDAARALGNGLLCVFASDIGADGQPLVKLVADTTTSPIIEHSGTAATLEMSWCAASLRAIHQGRSK